jgi:molybdate transport system ATP-binding protein
MTFSFSAKHRFDNFEIDASFTMKSGVTALFGRSGSGKTSILKMIAGLIEPQAGQITLGDQLVYDSHSRRSIPPHKRRLGYVFQEPRLFPHLSVMQNLRYSTWFRQSSISKKEFETITSMLDLKALLDRQPNRLSGGEQQRVAIGRALMSSPQMLLMDEPLASLDQMRKAEILPFLEELCATSQVPIVYVSHSYSEVMRLANRVILLDQGRVTSIQSPQSLGQNDAFTLSLPRSELGALVEGRISSFDPFAQLIRIAVGNDVLIAPSSNAKIGEPLKVFIAARDVMLATQKPEGISALNILPATISAINNPHSGIANISLSCAGTTLLAQITTQSAKRLGLYVGMPIFAVIKAATFEQS